MELLPELEFLKLIDGMLDQPDVQEYQDLAAKYMVPAEYDQMLATDPFSAEYREMAFKLYLRLSRREGYVPAEDEKSGLGPVPDIWRVNCSLFRPDTGFSRRA